MHVYCKHIPSIHTSVSCPPLYSLVLFDIFVNMLAHNLAEPAYDADVAQLEYKLVAGEHGLVIRVKGFNHKLPVCIDWIVGFIHGLLFTFTYNSKNFDWVKQLN